KACLESLARHTPAGVAEVIVVDNGSTDETAHALAPLGKQLFGNLFTPIRWEENRNFGPACNAGAEAARAPMLFFLNNDTLLTPNWLPPLLEAFDANPRLGAVGPLLLYENGTVQHMGVTFAPPNCVFHLYARFPSTHRVVRQKRRLQAITGAALMVPQQLFQACNGFFADYRNGFEDVELSLRIRQQGYTLECIPSSTIYHLESQTPGRQNGNDFNSRLLFSRCSHDFFVDIHRHALRDGFVVTVDDALCLSVKVGKEESAELFSMVKGKSLEDLYSLVSLNPLWVEGHVALAQKLEAATALKEAACIWAKISNSVSSLPVLENAMRLAKAVDHTSLLEQVLMRHQMLCEMNSTPERAKIHCKQVLRKAQSTNDKVLENLYTEALRRFEVM
ncbi:glycosyltransferase family 2 protein, partial [Desulfovibrio cuneatus]|uniref:glycosyltransferase family 2 protein n=1 Tax=Desulfovibrio cuneatus TaxID=159728 RepID=UPI00054E9D6A